MTLVANCLVIPKRMHLSGTVMDIWRLTTLTFWGHVTSSVTWPFDSWGSTSYRWSIVTMCLSSTVMEIWPFALPGTEVGRRLVVNPQYYTISCTPLRYIKNGGREE